MQIIVKVFVIVQFTKNEKNRKCKKIKIGKMAQNGKKAQIFFKAPDPRWKINNLIPESNTKEFSSRKVSRQKIFRTGTLCCCFWGEIFFAAIFEVQFSSRLHIEDEIFFVRSGETFYCLHTQHTHCSFQFGFYININSYTYLYSLCILLIFWKMYFCSMNYLWMS